MSVRKNRIRGFYAEMYDLLYSNNISKTILNTYPDALDAVKSEGSYAIVELPYSIRSIDISDYDVKNTFARFTFFAQDKTYLGSRMPNVRELERMVDSFLDLLPFRGDGFELMYPRSAIPPKKADTHYHYCILNVPVIFR